MAPLRAFSPPPGEYVPPERRASTPSGSNTHPRPSKTRYIESIRQRGPPVVRRVLHRRRAVAHGARTLEEVLEHAVEHEARLEDVAVALAPPARRDGQRLATLWQSNGSRLRGAREEKEGNIGISRRLRVKGAQPFRRDGSRRAPNTGAGTPPDETSVRVFTHLARSC